MVLSKLLSVALAALSFTQPVWCQYGYPGAPSEAWYLANVANANISNSYDTIVNASQADENLMNFVNDVSALSPCILYLRDGTFHVEPSFDALMSAGGNPATTAAALASSYVYKRFDVLGSGTCWQEVGGVWTVVIDLRPLSSAYNQASGLANPTAADWAAQGITINANGTVSYNITYVNQHDGLEIMHNHGQLGGWWVDGVPYLSANPLNSGETQTYTYTIDPKTNSGSYFLHSHYDFNAVQGMSVPLLIQNVVDSSYTYASVLNSNSTQEVVMYIEDFCLVYTNSDDALTGGDNYTDYHTVRDPRICERPNLAYRAVWGEWNSNKGQLFLGGGGLTQTLQQCLAPTLAPEFGFSYFLANEATFDAPKMVYAAPGTWVRLRIINAARNTNFLIELPQALNSSTVIAVDGHYVEPVLMTSFLTGGTFSNTSVWVGVAQRVDVLVQIPSSPDVYPIYAFEEAPGAGESNSPSFTPFEISYTAGIVLYSTTNPPATYSAASTTTTPIIPRSVTGVGMLSQHPNYLLNQNVAFKAWSSETPNGSYDWTNNWQTTATQLVTLPLSGYNGIFGLNFQPYYQFPPMIPLTTPKLIQPYKLNDTAITQYNLPGSTTQAPIKVSQGDRVCITFVNYNWDSHPMHMHGHSFKIVAINGVAVNGPIRDTVMVPAGNCNNLTICFNANATAGGVHGVHCHMVVHEMSGMFTAVEYTGYTPITTVQPTATTLLAASNAIALAAAAASTTVTPTTATPTTATPTTATATTTTASTTASATTTAAATTIAANNGTSINVVTNGCDDTTYKSGLEAATIVFAALFGASLVAVGFLSWKLRSHAYQPQSSGTSV